MAVEPYREDVYRQAMLYHHLIGNRSEALRLFYTCEEALREGLDAEPDTPTRRLFEQISSGHVPHVDPVYPPPKPVRHPVNHSLGRLPFVGRTAELARLLEGIERAGQGHGGLVLVGGEAGVGKTRLVQEAVRWARGRLQARALQGHCSELGTKLPYGALLQALRGHLDGLEREEMERLPSLGLAVLAPWLPGLGLDSAAEALPPLAPEQERLRFFEGCAQLLLTLAAERPPLVLVLDDLHWADPSTLDFCDYLLNRAAEHPLLLVGTYRVEEVDAAHPLASLARQATRGESGRAADLRLARLPRAELTELFQGLLPALEAEEREQLADRLHRESDGNPLFLVATLQTLFEEGALSATPEGHGEADLGVLAAAEPQALPREIQAVITARIERLRPAARQLLEALSVVGPRCDAELVERVTPELSPPDRDEHFDDLTRAGLIVEEGDAYLFTHDKIHEVAYHEAGETRRRRLHRRVAQVLAERPERARGLLAHHYTRAGLPAQALTHLLPLLKDAVAGYRNAEGLQLAAEAWDLTERLQPPESEQHSLLRMRAQILTERIKIHDILGQREEQRAALEELLHIAETLGEEALLAQARLRKAEYHTALSEYPQAQAESWRGLKLALRSKDRRLEGRALHAIAIVHWSTGSYEDARAYLDRELALQTTAGDERGLTKTLHYLGLVSWRSGRYEEAEAYYRRALKRLEAGTDRQGRSQVLLDLGVMCWSKGEYRRAKELFEEVRGLAAEISDRRGEANALSNLGLTARRLGEYEAALEYIEEAARLHREIGDQRSRALDLNNLGLVHWSLGRDEAARRRFEQAGEIFREVGWAQGEALTLNNLALLHRRSGEFERALELSGQALAIHRGSGDQRNLGVVLRNLGEIHHDCGNLNRALESFEQALVVSRALGSQEEEMLTLADQSATYLALGKIDRAVERSQEAGALLEDAERSAHAPQVLLARFRALEATGSEREAEALNALRAAHEALIGFARQIRDPALREGFLKIPIHGEILAVYDRLVPKNRLSEPECYALLRRVRWPEGVRCAHCGCETVRAHGRVSDSTEKRYRCTDCSKTFSDRTRTVFAHSNLPLPALFRALLFVADAAAESNEAKLLANALEVHPRTAAKLAERLRAALREDRLIRELTDGLREHAIG
jgi:tetratricopeptide (TPR) repeat protein